MICDKCRNENEVDSVFCKKCGNHLHHNAFASQSITENDSFMQADTQNDNIQTIKTFLNEETPLNETPISSNFNEEPVLNMQEIPAEDINDSISLEDTKEIEIPKNITEINLNEIIYNSSTNFSSSDYSASSLNLTKDVVSDEISQDVNNVSCDISLENHTENETRAFSGDIELDVNKTESLNEEPVKTPESPFKISVSNDENIIPQDFLSEDIPHVRNPYIGTNPMPTFPNLQDESDSVEVLELVVMFLFALVPVIGLIYHLSYAFSKRKNKFKQKVSKAILLTYLFICVIAIMFFVGFIIGII